MGSKYRNLLYTGLTKARQLAILVGPPKSIGFAMKRMLDRQRYTAFTDRLKQTGHDFLAGSTFFQEKRHEGN